MEINGLEVPEDAHGVVARILKGKALDDFNNKEDIILKHHQLKDLIEALTHWGMHVGYDLAQKPLDGKHDE